jgi:hypothetical protein
MLVTQVEQLLGGAAVQRAQLVIQVLLVIQAQLDQQALLVLRVLKETQ